MFRNPSEPWVRFELDESFGMLGSRSPCSSIGGSGSLAIMERVKRRREEDSLYMGFPKVFSCLRSYVYHAHGALGADTQRDKGEYER